MTNEQLSEAFPRVRTTAVQLIRRTNPPVSSAGLVVSQVGSERGETTSTNPPESSPELGVPAPSELDIKAVPYKLLCHLQQFA